jgi:hypothetical protein
MWKIFTFDFWVYPSGRKYHCEEMEVYFTQDDISIDKFKTEDEAFTHKVTWMVQQDFKGVSISKLTITCVINNFQKQNDI